MTIKTIRAGELKNPGTIIPGFMYFSNQRKDPAADFPQKRSIPLLRYRQLPQSNDVVIRVLYGGDQHAPADIFNFPIQFGAGIEQRLQAFADIVNLIVAERS